MLTMLSKLRAKMPTRAQEAAVYRTPSGTFAIPGYDLTIGRELRKGRGWADSEVRMLSKHCRPTDRVLVVGAHVGTLAIPLASHVTHVTAIEANPVTYRYLAANVALNGADNVTTIQVAAGESKGAIEFISNTQNSGGSKRKPIIGDPIYYYDSPSVSTVAMDRLDDVLPDQFDIVFMDIEGSEIFAMRGMPRIISQARVFAVEYIPHHLTNVGGCSVREFHSALRCFRRMLVPETGIGFQGQEIIPEMERMFANGEASESLIFSRHD